MKTTYCKGCGRPIVFICSPAGKLMPCDAVPVPYWLKYKGSKKIVTSRGIVLSCELEGDPATSTGLGYTSHFSTCPKADAFRKRGR